MTKRKYIDKSISNLHTSRAHGLRARVREAGRLIYVLIACEESGIECEAFRNVGFEAYHCDVIKRHRGVRKDWMICQDVTPLLNGQQHTFRTLDGGVHLVPHWDLVVAHPPCTYLSRLGAQYMFPKGGFNEERFRLMVRARQFWHDCYYAKASYVCVENPVPLECAALPRPSCYVEPYWFGDCYTKKTLYWLRNLPPLMPLIFHPFPKSLVAASSKRYRSRTSAYIAAEMALQWGDYILNELTNTTDYGHQ